jgi:hypothetical protein
LAKPWCEEVNKKVESRKIIPVAVLTLKVSQNFGSGLSLLRPIRSDVFLTSLELL